MEEWPKYLNKILEIKKYAEAERTKNILEAFARIEALLDDANLRRQEDERMAALEEAERKRQILGGEKFDSERRMAALKRIGRPEPWSVAEKSKPSPKDEEERPSEDPLAQFL